MSTIKVNPEIFQQELSLNDDAILVASVEDLIAGWKRKQSTTIAIHLNSASTHVPSNNLLTHRANRNLQISSSISCHLSKNIDGMNTDNAPSISMDNIGQTINFVDKYLSGWIVPIKDIKLHVVPIVKDLGFRGKVLIKSVKGKDYVIIKGYAGSRSFLTGTKYLSTHPKIIQLAIGKIGLQKTIRGGGRLTMYLTIGIELLQLVVGEKEIRECGISIASDLIKIGITTIIVEAVGLAAAGSATVGAIAAGPIIIAIVVGVVVASTLDYFDSEFNITNRVAALIEAMATKISEASEEASETIFGNIYQGIRQGIYRAMGGVDIENPVRFW